MMVYKGRTFCTAVECKHFSGCDEALTAYVQADASRLGLLISQIDKLDCYEVKDEE